MPIFNQVVAGSGGGSVAEPYLEYEVDSNGVLQHSKTTNHIIDINGATSIGTDILNYAYIDNTNISGAVNFGTLTTLSNMKSCFSGCTGITSIDLHSATSITGCYHLCYGCTNLGGNIDLSSVTSISGQNGATGMFINTKITGLDLSNLTSVDGLYAITGLCEGCTLLTKVSMGKLTTISVNSSDIFAGCTSLTSVGKANDSVDLTNLTRVGNYVFSNVFDGCTALITGRFVSLNSMGISSFANIFKNCSSLQSVWFYALKTTSFGNYSSQMTGMLSGCTNVAVHFPIAIQSTIGSWTSVTNGFDGTNTTVLFDLVTSLTGADGNTYTRQEKDSTSTATAWVYNDTLYYTSGVSDNANGVNEPSVSDAIYSDAACTQSVTTITAIA